ncbi:C-type lectin domain family 4 member M [Bagarius yarrelli]|uniref:C-type lectin domain family 4 member M n=1 Tax=Bagarius yarrelli TaxID=175774 RepID=A0A556UG42_BAGYA|nr:C-type lectin domain family 4 member M [Bagarius yarrelli]
MDSDYMNYFKKDESHVEMVVEIYDSIDAVKDHHLNKETGTTDVRSIHTKPLGLNTAWSKYYRTTAVCVLLLCVLLLTAVTMLGIKCNKLNTANNQLQTRYNNLTNEKKQLQLQRDQYHQEVSELHSVIFQLGGTPWGRGYWLTAACLLLLCVLLLTAVTVLWIKYDNINTGKDQLQTGYNNLNIQTDQLQSRYNNMKNENNQLKFQRDQLLLHQNHLMLQQDQLRKETSGLQNVLLKYGWKLYNSSVYKVSDKKKNWHNSQVDCTAIGAVLVIVNSKEEQEFISKSFSSTDAWIGLNDLADEGNFIWVDGSPLTTK